MCTISLCSVKEMLYKVHMYISLCHILPNALNYWCYTFQIFGVCACWEWLVYVL